MAACTSASFNYANVNFDEPKAMFWSDGGCQNNIGRGSMMYLPPGDYPSLVGKPIGNNNIDSIWVPPNMSLEVFDAENYISPITEYGPGYYPDLNAIPGTPGGVNIIESMRLKRIRSWQEHLVNCCTGKVANGATPEVCGAYWGKTDTSGQCDDIMEVYCDPDNPNSLRKDDPKCSCYFGDQELSKSLVSNPAALDVNAMLAQPQCFFAKCSTRGYLPSNMNNPLKKCPTIKVCRQDITIDGKSNLLNDNLFVQDCSDRIVVPGATGTGQTSLPSGSSSGSDANDNPAEAPSPWITPNDSSDSSSFVKDNILYIVVAFVALIAIVLTISYRKSPTPPANYPPGYYPGSYPPANYPPGYQPANYPPGYQPTNYPPQQPPQ